LSIPYILKSGGKRRCFPYIFTRFTNSDPRNSAPLYMAHRNLSMIIHARQARQARKARRVEVAGSKVRSSSSMFGKPRTQCLESSPSRSSRQSRSSRPLMLDSHLWLSHLSSLISLASRFTVRQAHRPEPSRGTLHASRLMSPVSRLTPHASRNLYWPYSVSSSLPVVRPARPARFSLTIRVELCLCRQFPTGRFRPTIRSLWNRPFSPSY
jgi:hypothetical protein